MGIALGVGLIVGARAAVTGNVVLIFLLAALLAGMALATSDWPRRLLVCAALGCLVGSAIGAWRAPEPPPPVADLSQTEFHGVLFSDPRTSAIGWSARFGWTDSNGFERTSFAYLPIVPVVGRGDRVTIHGDFGESLGATIYADAVRLNQRAGPLELQRRRIRDAISGMVQRRVPGSPGALALGLLIGDDSGLSAEERDNLRRSGLSHITAVSGWNVTVVVTSIGALFLALRLRGWPWLALQLVGLLLYVWVVGIEPPILRAALMGATALVALQLGRPAHMLTLLSLAAAVMVLISPAILSSLSFQLSVLAMVGLLAVAGLDRSTAAPPRMLFVPVAASGAAGLATSPLLALRFGAISLATIPANVVVSPLIPAATWSGILLLIAGWVPVLGAVLGTLTWALCGLVLWCAAAFANLPGAYIAVASLSAGVVVLVYLALVVLMLPFLPESRLLLSRLQRWYDNGPASASATLAGLIVVLLLALVAL